MKKLLLILLCLPFIGFGQTINNIADISFDYQITVFTTVAIDKNSAKWRIPMYISVYKNDNFNNELRL